MKKNLIKKIFFISFVFIVIFFLFKIFIGEINLNFSNIFSQHKSRLYEVSLNDDLINIGVEETKKTTIIPFIVYANDFSSHSFYSEKDESELKFNLNDMINVSIKSYECYSNNTELQLSCVGATGLKKVIVNDTDYTLRIKRLNKAETITYNGEFLSDISGYFPEKGRYRIFIYGKYKNVTSTIYFDIEIM